MLVGDPGQPDQSRDQAALVAATPGNRRQFFYGFLMSSVRAADEVRLFGLGDFLRERMRVAVARGLMRANRDLLILDEPSSGLDAEAEHAIHRQLIAIRDGRTSLLRLGSVRDADSIMVLSDGRIAERGTHPELMAARGEYCRLFRLQASGYETDGEPSRAGRPRKPALFRTPDDRSGTPTQPEAER